MGSKVEHLPFPTSRSPVCVGDLGFTFRKCHGSPTSPTFGDLNKIEIVQQQNTHTRARATMAEKKEKVLKIFIDKVLCADKDGTLALPGLEKGMAFIRIELRGGIHSQKISTASSKMKDNCLAFNTSLALDLAEDASELRLLLCKKKDGEGSQNTVLSAAGIYVKDIIRAAPIVKWFDLFKSFGTGFGGQVKLSLTIADKASEEDTASPKEGETNGAKSSPGKSKRDSKPEAKAAGGASKKSNKGGFPFKLLLLAAVGGAFAFTKLKK